MGVGPTNCRSRMLIERSELPKEQQAAAGCGKHWGVSEIESAIVCDPLQHAMDVCISVCLLVGVD